MSSISSALGSFKSNRAVVLTKFLLLFQIQQKEHLPLSKLKLPTQSLPSTHASALKRAIPPPHSPTPAVSMWRHLRGRRAAPRLCST